MNSNNPIHLIEERLHLEFLENGGKFTDIRNHDDEYDEEQQQPFEPSHNSKGYNDWEFKERLIIDWMALQEELVKMT